MKIHYKGELKSFARKLRKTSTLGEVLLWAELKQNKLGHRFLRQVPIETYIADFYCHQLRMAIEIDGAASHDQRVTQDKQRQKEIESIGIRVVRFSETEVRENLESVIESIKEEVAGRMKVARTREK
jgi:very-short-patch-repair endonuclease